jgi:hypothetical protein
MEGAMSEPERLDVLMLGSGQGRHRGLVPPGAADVINDIKVS